MKNATQLGHPVSAAKEVFQVGYKFPSIVAMGAAIIAVWGQLRVKRVEAQLAWQKAEAEWRVKAEQTAGQFREPLGRAAYELQSRIFNIVRSGFAEAYIRSGKSPDQDRGAPSKSCCMTSVPSRGRFGRRQERTGLLQLRIGNTSSCCM